MSRQELRSTGGNCQGDDRQESCSSAGNCQADVTDVAAGWVLGMATAPEDPTPPQSHSMPQGSRQLKGWAHATQVGRADSERELGHQTLSYQVWETV